jgi:hypothetical protein
MNFIVTQESYNVVMLVVRTQNTLIKSKTPTEVNKVLIQFL